MPTLVKNLFHRRAIRFGMASDPRGKFRDPRFVSFISESNRKTLNTDLKDTVLKARKLVRYALVVTVACAGAWVVIESAPALSIF